MLGKDVLMEDIDIDQWRNAQDLLESAKEKKRIIVLHDNGAWFANAVPSMTASQLQAHRQALPTRRRGQGAL